MKFDISIIRPEANYELVDSGEGEKLERFGDVVLSRPDPQALWPKNYPDKWKNADGIFTRKEKQGDWNIKKNIPEKWEIDFASLKFWIKPSAFKHVGLFPEQETNWDWMRGLIKNETEKNIEVLNLFGYTGGATLACAEAGANVVHVDGSKSAITWARENAIISGLDKKPIRWILDDARAFVKREIKRGRKYHGIIMDPPAFGHGPKDELWKIEDDLLPLMKDCIDLLIEKPLFFIINGYSAGYSAIAYGNNLIELEKKFGGSIEMGELGIGEKDTKRVLPCGIFARWRK